MQTSTNAIDKNQDRKRYVVFLNAEYLKPPAESGECVVVNITPGGACVMLPPKAVFVKGEALSLEIKTRGFEKVIVSGTIAWLKKIETACIAGVKFSTPLDMYSFKKMFW